MAEYLYVLDPVFGGIKEYRGEVEIFSTQGMFRTEDNVPLPHFGKTHYLEGKVAWNSVWFKEPKSDTQVRDAFIFSYEDHLRYTENRIECLKKNISTAYDSSIERSKEHDKG